ncbi:MAG TPA: hypothetical protein VIQ74_09745 [Gemmatimonadaceae bacterium]|jgi:hypothetical protein
MGKVYLRDIEGAEQYRERRDLVADFLEVPPVSYPERVTVKR